MKAQSPLQGERHIVAWTKVHPSRVELAVPLSVGVFRSTFSGSAGYPIVTLIGVSIFKQSVQEHLTLRQVGCRPLPVAQQPLGDRYGNGAARVDH